MIVISKDSRISITLFAFLFLWATAPAYASPSQRTPPAIGIFQLRAAAQSQQQSDTRDLKPGQPIEDELAVNKSHAYRATLKAGEYISVVVEQKGIDVAVTLFGTDGKKIADVDIVPANEKESISLVGEASGEYVLEVRRRDGAAKERASKRCMWPARIWSSLGRRASPVSPLRAHCSVWLSSA